MNRDDFLEILTRIFNFIGNHRMVLMGLAIVVVFITTYLLILPALT